MDRTMLDYRWNLRQVMASRDMFQTTDLIEPLAQRGIRSSSSQVYRLVVERPERHARNAPPPARRPESETCVRSVHALPESTTE